MSIDDDDVVELVPEEPPQNPQEIPYMEDPVAQRVVACSFLLKTIGTDNERAVEEAVNLLGAVIRSISDKGTPLSKIKG